MNASSTGSPDQDPAPSLRTVLTDAFRYWEWRRLPYNLILAAVTVGCAGVAWPETVAAFKPGDILPLFVLAVLANVCYCAVYLADVPAQYSGFRDAWRRRRWMLWLIGTLFAATLAYYWLADEVLPFLGT